MDGGEGLLTCLERTVHHIPSFLPGGSRHGVPHSAMQILHLGRVALNHLGVSIPGSGLCRCDAELGLQSIKISGRIGHATQRWPATHARATAHSGTVGLRQGSSPNGGECRGQYGTSCASLHGYLHLSTLSVDV